MKHIYQIRALLLALLVFLALILPFLGFMNYLEKKSIEGVLEKCRMTVERFTEAVLLSQENRNRDYMSFYFENEALQRLMDRALRGEEAQVRVELYARFWKAYEELRDRALIRDVQFVLPDGRVLLRMRTPYLYGDNLQEVNPVVETALKEWSPKRGFGTDRFLSGYVYAYPIEGQTGERLGLLVFYVSLQNIKNFLQQVNPGVNYVFLLKGDILDRLLPEYRQYYQEVEGLKGWLVENPFRKLDRTSEGLSQKEQELLNRLVLREDFVRALSTPGNHIMVFSSGESHYKAIMVKIKEKDKEGAALVSMPSGEDIYNISRSYLNYKLIFCALAFVVAFYTFFYVREVYKLRLSYRELEGVLSLTNTGVVVLSSSGRIEIFNNTAAEMLGYTPEELSGKLFYRLVGKREQDLNFSTVAEAIYEGEDSFVRKDGKTIEVQVALKPIKLDGSTEAVVLSFYDITERKEKEKSLYYRASHDKLTGLFNRWYAEDFCRSELARVKRQGSKLSLLLIDVDKFKTINDTYGHSVGDQVLKTLAQILRSSLREYDLLARWGGEEFLILLPEDGLGEALTIAERLRRRVEEFSHPDLPTFTISIGLAVYREGETFEDLLERADRALYKAKEQGRNRVVAEE